MYQRILENNRAEMAASRAADTSEEEEPAPEAEDVRDETAIDMNDFVAQHRTQKLPGIQRQHQLVERQRIALGGKPKY